jgi:hypothetical protein
MLASERVPMSVEEMRTAIGVFARVREGALEELVHLLTVDGTLVRTSADEYVLAELIPRRG